MDTALDLARERIRAATANRTPLRIRGGGSKDFYGRSLQGELLDTAALSGIISYEPSELVVTVRAGTPLAELEALLAAQNQYLPFEPPHFRSALAAVPAAGAASGATVGGMVAAGLSGPARASAGSVRDHVLGVTMLNGRAELLSFGGQVIKNVAGYDLSRLMAGAMGSLGLLVNISLKVLPLPPAEATLVFELGQAEALAQLNRWGAQPLPLNASCWVQDSSAASLGISGLSGTGPELLFVRLRGAVAAVASASRQMLADVPASVKPRQMDTAEAAADWRLCRDQQLPFFTQAPGPDAAPDNALWRLSVAQTAPVLDLPWPQFIEWHGGQRWLWAPLSAAARLRAAAIQAGGHATVFRAPAGVDTTGLDVFAPLTPPLDRIHHQLKAEFDPAGIFNPGRLYDSL